MTRLFNKNVSSSYATKYDIATTIVKYYECSYGF